MVGANGNYLLIGLGFFFFSEKKHGRQLGMIVREEI